MKFLASALLALVLSAGSAQAEPRNVKQADALFREGRALMKDGDFSRACAKLERSYQLDPAAGTAVNLGDCFERIGKTGSALLAYQAAQKILSPGDPRNAPVARQIDALMKRVPRLTIALARDAPDGTTVTRDGRDVDPAQLGRPAVVNPGRVVVVVSAPGRVRVRTVLTVSDWDKRSFVADVGEHKETTDRSVSAPGREPSPSGARNPTADSSSNSTGLVLGGIGLVGVTTGVVTALMANSKESVASTNCDSAKRCNQTGFDAAESGKTLNTVSYVAWGVGVAGVALGGYFLFLAGPDESSAAVGASASASGGEVTVKGRFW